MEAAESPVIFQDHGWRRYDLVVLAFDATLGIVLVLLGIAFTADIGSKGGPPPYLGPMFLLLGGWLAWFGLRVRRTFKRRKVVVFPDRVEVDNGRKVTTVPSSDVEHFESRASDALQVGLAQRVYLRTKEGRAIPLPLLSRGRNVEILIHDLQRAVGH
jgi:hypothetical protein